MKKGKNKLKLAASALLSTALLLDVGAAHGAATAPLPVTGAAGIGMDNPTLQAQLAEMESMRLSQIKNALLADFWKQYRIYIQTLASGNSTTEAIYPMWPLSSTPNDPKANFRYLADKYLPDLKDQLKSLSKTTGIPETDFYEIQYVPPEEGMPLPASGHVVIRRLHAETATQGRIRGLLAAVTVTDIGENGVISMRVDPPSAFMGSDALNVALVRNNGLTLDPDIAKQLAESETGGPDLTFLPGTWVTFGKKGTNVGTAQAKNVDPNTVHTPTIRFKGQDGNIIGVNSIEMTQVFSDPVARILFKRTAEALGGTMDANYIRFEDNRGAIVGLEHLYNRDGPDGKSGNDLALAIWAQAALGGDTIILNAGDTVNGENANKGGTIRFGLNDGARVYFDAAGELKIESNKAARIKAPAVTVDGNLEVTGTSNLNGAVTMKNGLNMSNTNINNVATLNAAAAILNALTLGGKTGSQSNPYSVWVTNAAKASFADNAGLLNGKSEGSLSVARAAIADSLSDPEAIFSPFLPSPGSGNVTANELSDALWKKIQKLIQDGKGNEVRIGYHVDDNPQANKEIFMPFYLDPIAPRAPFPNECLNFTVVTFRELQSKKPLNVSWSSSFTKEGISFSPGNGISPYELYYVAVGY
jgi:hypothetical protein